ncbi:MAG: hypothetical protein ACKVQS_11425 [Fimbriimonadaceae bacterium]
MVEIGGLTVTVKNTPSASLILDYGLAECLVAYRATIINPEITWKGVTRFDDGNSFITGQQATAEIRLKSSFTGQAIDPISGPIKIASRNWSIPADGMPFKDFVYTDNAPNGAGNVVPFAAADLQNEKFKFFTKDNGNVTTRCQFTMTFPANATFKAQPTLSRSLTLPTMAIASNPVVSIRPTATGLAVGGAVFFRTINGRKVIGPLGEERNGEGEVWQASLNPINKFGYVGKTCFVQIGKFTRGNRRSLKDGFPVGTPTEFVLEGNGEEWLDVRYPYPWSQGNSLGNPIWDIGKQSGVDPNGNPIMVANPVFGSDSPAHALELFGMDGNLFDWTNRWEFAEATDEFKTYVMYLPPQNGSERVVWVPIKSFTWDWIGKCDRSGYEGAWKILPGAVVNGNKDMLNEFSHPTWHQVKAQGDFTFIPK